MKGRNLGLYVLAAAVVVAAAMAFGVQASNVWPLVLAAACPLMMIFMMRGMHGGSDNDAGNPKGDERDAGIRRP